MICMIIFIMIYLSTVFEVNHIFLFRCLHRNLVTSGTIIEEIANRTSLNKSNTCFLKYLPNMKKYNDIFGCLILVYTFIYIKLLYLTSKSVLASAREKKLRIEKE